MYALQQSLESYSKIDDSLEEMELLQFAANDDTIVFVVQTKTKKIMLIDPKSFLVVRMIKKISKNEFIECQKSLNLTDLIHESYYADKLESLKNVAEMHLGANWIKSENGVTTEKVLTKVDILSSTSGMVIKPFLKKKFSQVYKNRTREIVRFILDTKPEDYVNLKWFTNDEARIDEIFQESRTILKHLKLHLSYL
jgi:hypothetical protein